MNDHINPKCLLQTKPYEPWHDKTNKMTVRIAKSQISLGIRPVWLESSLCAQLVAKDSSFLYADSDDSDQTGLMPRLIWVFAWRILILLVLSCRGSYSLEKDSSGGDALAFRAFAWRRFFLFCNYLLSGFLMSERHFAHWCTTRS